MTDVFASSSVFYSKFPVSHLCIEGHINVLFNIFYIHISLFGSLTTFQNCKRVEKR